MKFKFLNLLALFGITSLLLTSCIKDDVKELGDAGSTFVKILEAPEKPLYFSPFTDVRKVDLFSVRRDANSSGELNSNATVKLTLNEALIDEYNDENNTNYELLPDSLYTLVDPSMKLSATEYAVNFGSGDFAKEFTINLNGAKWDIAHTYAMAFNITDSAGKKLTDGKDQIIVLISVKNAWDGVYEVSGTLTDLVAPTILGYYPLKWDLVTSGPNTITVFDREYTGTPTHIIESGGSLSQYGTFGLVFDIDPATNKITNIRNYYGEFAGGFKRNAALDPTGINAYDPDTKTFHVKYLLQQGDNRDTRTIFDETWKYVGER